MISELILNRIQSKLLKSSSDVMRAQILQDTTPVPVFGRYKDSKIVTVGINPSSKEFPSGKNRRLTHLSDVKLPSNYYQLGLNSMSTEQAMTIENGLTNYFLNDPYYDWFSYPEMVLNIGFAASYKSNEPQMSGCHLDIFPWATTQFSGLDKAVQKEFYTENASFIKTYLFRGVITNLIILGNDTFKLIQKQLALKINIRNSKPGPFSSTFEQGIIELESKVLPYFYTSQGPSVQFKTPEEKKVIHDAFGNFIKEFQEI